MGRVDIRSGLINNVFCLKLDAKSVPDALATSIRIVLMSSIVLAHSRIPPSLGCLFMGGYLKTSFLKNGGNLASGVR